MNQSNKLAKVKVFRFNPAMDREPRYQTYEVVYEGSTVLDVLRYIYENIDPTLAFRFGCAGGTYQRCGACSVLVNSTAVLSCKKLAEENMTIEPHPRYEHIRDLAIDFDKPKIRTTTTAVKVKIIVDPKKCTGCRDCARLCPSKVYEIQKIEGKGIAVPEDIGSCNGLTCQQCAVFCRESAITIEAID